MLGDTRIVFIIYTDYFKVKISGVCVFCSISDFLLNVSYFLTKEKGKTRKEFVAIREP